MKDLSKWLDAFCKENGLSVHLSQEMPEGYEDAFGTYDVTLGTLFLNLPLLQNAPEYEGLFYLCHELRHAMQYLHPEQFDPSIRESLPYVILYNGVCFRLVENEWRECVLEGDEAYFTEAYLSLPYEIDANAFAYQQVKAQCGDSDGLQKLYASWTPQRRWPYEEHQQLFMRIDRRLALAE